MTEVRIRHEDDTEADSLGDVPFGEIDGVIDFLKRWGVIDSGGNAETNGLHGQFRVPDSGPAFFEVCYG